MYGRRRPIWGRSGRALMRVMSARRGAQTPPYCSYSSYFARKLWCPKLRSMEAGRPTHSGRSEAPPEGRSVGGRVGATHRRKALGNGGLHPPYKRGNAHSDRLSDGSPGGRCRADGPPILLILLILRTKLWWPELRSLDVSRIIGAIGRLALGFQQACRCCWVDSVRYRRGWEFDGSGTVAAPAVGRIRRSAGSPGQPLMSGVTTPAASSPVPSLPTVGRVRSVGLRLARQGAKGGHSALIWGFWE
jgi:hypothetical protein